MSSLPEESPVKSQSSSSSLTHKEQSGLKIYQLNIQNGSISRSESCEEMDDGDFIIKMTDPFIFYKDFHKRKPTLEYLLNPFRNMNYNLTLKDLKDSHNETFNLLFKDLDKDVQDCIKEAEKQIAFVLFRKKDGSFDKSKTKVIKLNSRSKEHTEDTIFPLMQEIYNENHCDYYEMYIFSTNSPCLARKDCVPCMIRAFFWAYLLNKEHGMKIIFGYIRNYGLNGSYDNNLPFNPIKDFISTIVSQTYGSKDIISTSPSPQKQKKHTHVDMDILNPVYKKIIAEEKNKKFPMGVPKDKPPSCDLKNNISKKVNFKIYNELHTIKKNWFKIPELDEKSFDDFYAYGLELSEKYSSEILNLGYDEKNTAKVLKHLQTLFFSWWAKNLEASYSKFLNEQLNHKLKNYALHLSLMEIEEIQNKLGRIFFEIGVVTFNYSKCSVVSSV